MKVDFWCDFGSSYSIAFFLGVAPDLTRFSRITKKPKRSKLTKNAARKLGRPEELKIGDLPKRFQHMKSFLENYWGRVGLGLRKARQAEDVRSILTFVQGVEWNWFSVPASGFPQQVGRKRSKMDFRILGLHRAGCVAFTSQNNRLA